MRKERNIGIDLLRIVSMCMIIMIHMNGYGKASENIDAFSLKHFVAQALGFLVACAVNSYALISGFVNCTKTTKQNSFYSFFRLWGQVLFYSVLIMLIFKSLYPDEISIRQMIEAFFPAMSMQYWYFTFYIPVLLLMPYFNFFLEKIDICFIRKMIALLFLLFSVIPWVCQTDWFGLDGGFSTFWLIILYLLGAWIRKEMDNPDSWMVRCKKRYLFLILCVLVGGQVILRNGLDIIGIMLGKENGLMHSFGSYTSPFMVAEAIVLILLFAKLQFPHDRMQTFISKMGAASFGVYLMHDNQFVRQYILIDNLSGIGQLNTVMYLVAMVGTAIVIYISCALLELVRGWIFKNVGSIWGKQRAFIDE